MEALRCLFAEPDELSGREIARRTGLSHLIIHKALGELEAEGIVERRVAPPAHQFQLNRKHWVVSGCLAPLFQKEAAWPEHLGDRIRQGAPKAAASIIFFGSLAAGKLAPRSDIDVLVLVREKAQEEEVRRHFQDLSGKVYSAFGHPLSVLVMTEGDLLEQYRTGKRFARDIAYSGRVIHGRLLTEVLFQNAAKKD